MTEALDVGLRLSQIFLGSVSFHHRADALQLPADTKHPDTGIDVEVALHGHPGDPATALALRVRSRPESKPLYTLDLLMYALVQTSEATPLVTPHEFLVQGGVSLLFPFVREAVANITMRGRFGPLWLNPINVRVLAKGAAETAQAPSAK